MSRDSQLRDHGVQPFWFRVTALASLFAHICLRDLLLTTVLQLPVFVYLPAFFP